MRVLDMGCGTALTAIFLAREFDVQVWATDLWVKPTENLGRIVEQGAGNRVFPIYAEARALPFAENFFDAIVSFDRHCGNAGREAEMLRADAGRLFGFTRVVARRLDEERP
jgi:cyclopropane fatty-acyl-phospholipid synthase-like methyltransferase